jgi:Zn-dependent peptidase ImmA (M78 family)
MMDLLFCEQDRAALLAAAGPSCATLCPADLLDYVIEDVLGLALVLRPLPGPVLGLCSYDRSLITINTRMVHLVRPKTYLEGLMCSTKAHELAHLRIPHHETEVRDAMRRNQPLDDQVEARREEEADFYAGVFLVPTAALRATPQVAVWSGAAPEAWTSDALWREVVDLAHTFCVTGSLMARRLCHLGLMEKTEDRSLRLLPSGPAVFDSLPAAVSA